MKTKKSFALMVIFLLVSACTSLKETTLNTSVLNNIQNLKASPTPVAEATPKPTLSPTPSPTPDPYSLDALKNRTYGAGNFTVDRLWYSYDRFKRYYVVYDSDDLIIHGFVNVPVGEGPFPVIIALHGSVPRDEYQTLDYTTRYADDLSQDGYIVLHPNLRNFPPSSVTERRGDSHAGYTIDVLNLLAYVREMAGKEGIFETADINRMGIWGHSIGGGIAMRTMSVEPDAFKAAILYGAVSQRYATVLRGSGIFDFSEVDTKIGIHHGESDEVIPVEHSRLLCRQLEELGKEPECYFYEDQPHTLYRDQWADPLFMERTLEFFDKYLKNDLGD
jgi:dienelactone hydrolase